MSTDTTTRSQVHWVPINEVIPNPLNPRKNDAIETEEMQRIILSKGWEIPLTVYKKGKYYVVMAGHRRLYAAKQTRTLKEIPVYIVDPPEDHHEELERIASLQRGQVDWTPYEWGKFTYDRWLAWGKPPLTEFSKKAHIPRPQVKEYITVLKYFPRKEIESGLETKVFSMSALSTLVDFINKLKFHKTQTILDLSEDLVRQTLLKKLENGFITRDSMRRANVDLVEIWQEHDLVEFLNTTNMHLQTVLDEYKIDQTPRKTLQGKLISFGVTNKNIKEISVPQSKEEQKKLLRSLEKLEETIKIQLAALRSAQEIK